MNSLIAEFMLEDEDDDEFEELVGMCIPKYSLKKDNSLYNHIYNLCMNLTYLISEGDTDWLKPDLEHENNKGYINATKFENINYSR